MNNSKVITGKQLKDMLLGAYHSFEKNFEAINDLNVFPVPDGDTGTNMMHTMASVAKAISAMSDEAEAGEIGAAAARSAIMGARGNSGVILSQLLRGIGKGVAGKKTLNNTEIGKGLPVWYFICLPQCIQTGRRHYPDGSPWYGQGCL